MKFNRVEMRFQKTQEIKKELQGWEGIYIAETKNRYTVIVGEGSEFYSYFRTKPECRLCKNINAALSDWPGKDQTETEK